MSLIVTCYYYDLNWVKSPYPITPKSNSSKLEDILNWRYDENKAEGQPGGREGMSDLVLDDFAFMRNGKLVKPFTEQQLSVIEPIAEASADGQHAMLLIHDFASTPAVFYDMIEPIKQKGYAIYCPVLPGHGSSIEQFAQVSYQQWIDCVEQSYEDIAKCYQKVTVLGVALGGVLAYRLSQKYDLDCLFLLAPALALNVPMKLARTVLKAMRFLGFKNLGAMAGNIYQSDGCELAYKKIPINAMLEFFDCIETTPIQFGLPCLNQVFLGQHDKIINFKKVYHILFDSIILENCAHVLPLDNQRQLILDCIPDASR